MWYRMGNVAQLSSSRALKPGTIIALVFAGSALVAAALFALDARERRNEEAPSTRAPAEGAAPSTSASATAAAVSASAVADADAAPPLVSSALVSAARVAPRPSGDEPCFDDMVLVEGEFC